MIVLAFDTALAACSAALYDSRQDKVVSARHALMAQGHAEALPGMIAGVMRQAGLTMGAIDRIAVTRGPGTFTGVRIGLATARGLALALDRPAVGIGTLEALAAAVPPGGDAPIASIIDARRGEVYLQVFAANGTPCDDPRLIAVERAAEQIPDNACLVGTGANLPAFAACRTRPAEAPALPEAARFVRLAAAIAPDAASLEPLYLRAPDAKPQKPIVVSSQAPVAVIEATSGHAAILADLHASAFARGWRADEVAALMAAPGAIALLAVLGAEGREPAGFLLARKAADEAEILTLCTRPSARRRGVARLLVSALDERLQAAGVSSLFLEVNADNEAALALYRRLGFCAVGERRGYYGPSGERGCDAVIMRRGLKQA